MFFTTFRGKTESDFWGVILEFLISLLLPVGIGFYGSYEIIFSATKVWGSRLAWSRLVDLGSIDSGSNPGSPTILTLLL